MIRSVIEGVCYSQKDGLDIIEGMGVPVTSVRVSGGGAKSTFWRQLLADVLGKRVVVLNTQEGSAYGAALLALANNGPYGSVAGVCRAAIREVDSVEPQPEQSARYAAAHATYQALYPALKPVYEGIAASASA
jgi:xylulokinase